MKIVLPLLFCCLLPNLYAQKMDTTEPPLTVQMTIDGKVYTAKEGEQLKLKNTYRNPTVSFQTSKTRQFTIGSLSFEYPQQYAFAYEKDENSHSWTMGNGAFTVMVFYYPDEAKSGPIFEAFVASMASQLEASSPVVTPVEKTFGGKTVKGKRLYIPMDSPVNYDLFAIETGGGTLLIGFNDVLDEGNSSASYQETIALMARTMKY